MGNSFRKPALSLKSSLEEFQILVDLVISCKVIIANIVNAVVDVSKVSLRKDHREQFSGFEANKINLLRKVRKFLLFLKYEMMALELDWSNGKTTKFDTKKEYEGMSVQVFIETVANDCFLLAKSYSDFSVVIREEYKGQIFVNWLVGSLLIVAGALGGAYIIFQLAGAGLPLAVDIVTGSIVAGASLSGIVVGSVLLISQTEAELAAEYLRKVGQGLKSIGLQFDSLAVQIRNENPDIVREAFKHFYDHTDALVADIEPVILA
jgi:hypothetical protein